MVIKEPQKHNAVSISPTFMNILIGINTEIIVQKSGNSGLPVNWFVERSEIISLVSSDSWLGIVPKYTQIHRQVPLLFYFIGILFSLDNLLV